MGVEDTPQRSVSGAPRGPCCAPFPGGLVLAACLSLSPAALRCGDRGFRSPLAGRVARARRLASLSVFPPFSGLCGPEAGGPAWRLPRRGADGAGVCLRGATLLSEALCLSPSASARGCGGPHTEGGGVPSGYGPCLLSLLRGASGARSPVLCPAPRPHPAMFPCCADTPCAPPASALPARSPCLSDLIWDALGPGAGARAPAFLRWGSRAGAWPAVPTRAGSSCPVISGRSAARSARLPR